MIKRLILIYYISLSILLFLGLSIILLTIDYNKYKFGSKQTTYKDSDILLSLHSYDGKSESGFLTKSLGHSWISIENNSSCDIYLNDILIIPGDVLTISVFSIEKNTGVTYNLEAMFIDKMNRYDNHYSISYPINENDLDKIGKFIEENNKWSILKNCTYFSIHLFNEVVKEEYKIPTQIISYTPSKLIKAIKEYSNYEVNKSLKNYTYSFIIKNKKVEVLDLC